MPSRLLENGDRIHTLVNLITVLLAVCTELSRVWLRLHPPKSHKKGAHHAE